MTRTWPATLPPLLTGALLGTEETPPDLQLRTQMDAGPAKMRRKHSVGVRKFQLRWLLTGAQKQALDSFYYDELEGGTLRFSWRPDADATLHDFRFEGVVKYVDAPDSADRYIATATLERMP